MYSYMKVHLDMTFNGVGAVMIVIV